MRHYAENWPIGPNYTRYYFCKLLGTDKPVFHACSNPAPINASHPTLSAINDFPVPPPKPPWPQTLISCVVEKHSMGIFYRNLLRLDTFLSFTRVSSSHPYGGIETSVSRSWDHFLVDELRLAGAKDGIGSSVVVGFGLRAGFFAVLECARDCKTTCWVLS